MSSEPDGAEGGDEVLRLSWVPLFRSRLSGDMAVFAEYALRQRDQGAGVTLSNRGGWQSDDLLSAFQVDERLKSVSNQLHALTRRFVETYKTLERPDTSGVAAFEIEVCNLWANINAPGDWNAGHHHPGAHISGVFYAQASEGCGELVLRPPYTFFDVVLDHISQPSVEPQEGMVLLFPSDVFHSAEPNRGETDRVSYAFNARYRPITSDGRTLL